MFLGLRTMIYPTEDLEASKAWFTRLTGVEPYFDQPFYVGYSIGGYELALDPGGAMADGAITYWGVADCEEALALLVDAGAEVRTPVTEVGESIRVATVRNPAGNIIGVIENPHFRLPDDAPSPGPGR